MKINQNDSFWTSYNTKILKTNRGFSSKLKPYNSVNLAIGQACLYEHFCACQLYFKKPSEDHNIDDLDHLYGAILYDSYYVLRGLARGVSVVNFALSDATSKWSKMSFVNFALFDANSKWSCSQPASQTDQGFGLQELWFGEQFV